MPGRDTGRPSRFEADTGMMSGRKAAIGLALSVGMLTTAVNTFARGPSLPRASCETTTSVGKSIERIQLGPVAGLDAERIGFRSEATRDSRYFIALRPGDRPSTDDVLIFSHGWGNRPEEVIRRLDVARIYANLLAQGKVKPAVLVLPDVRFADEYRNNSEDYPFPQYLGLIGEEIYRIVSEIYSIPPDREKWHLGGFSFGGYLSLDVGRRYGARFGSVDVISAFGDPEWSYWPVEPPAQGRLDETGRGKQTLVDPGPAPRLLLACGTGDRMYPRMVRLHEQFAERGVAHVWLKGPGKHGFRYWKSVMEPVLLFHLGIRGGEPGRR